MTILRIEVCQICETIGKPTRKYRVGDEARLIKVPLCEDCVQTTPFAALLAVLAAKPQRRWIAPTVPTTMEQVAAAKKAAARPPKRRTAKKRG